MNYDPSVIRKLASAHFAAVSFISTACGLVAGVAAAAYGSRIGMHTAPQAGTEVWQFMDYSFTQAGAYAAAGFVSAWIPGFIAGKIVGFFLSYPIKVNGQLLLLAINVEESMRRSSGVPSGSGGTVLDFKRAA